MSIRFECLRGSFEGETFGLFKRDVAVYTFQSMAVGFLDSMTPQLSGRDVCQSLKSSTAPNPPQFIFVSARAGTRDRLDCYSAGADDYLRKPFDPDELRCQGACTRTAFSDPLPSESPKLNVACTALRA